MVVSDSALAGVDEKQYSAHNGDHITGRSVERDDEVLDGYPDELQAVSKLASNGRSLRHFLHDDEVL